MNWKDDFFARIEKLSGDVTSLYGVAAEIRVDMTRLAQAIEQSQNAYEKMSDRLIAMAMVQRGDTKSAAVYRSQERIEKTAEVEDDWEVPEEEQWPPPGCTRVDRF